MSDWTLNSRAGMSELGHQLRAGLITAPYGACKPTAAELQAKADAAKLKEAADSALDLVLTRLDAEQALATATSTLLEYIRAAIQRPSAVPTPGARLAQFRKELQPLALTYGYKIVLVGDKSRATIALV